MRTLTSSCVIWQAQPAKRCRVCCVCFAQATRRAPVSAQCSTQRRLRSESDKLLVGGRRCTLQAPYSRLCTKTRLARCLCSHGPQRDCQDSCSETTSQRTSPALDGPTQLSTDAATSNVKAADFLIDGAGPDSDRIETIPQQSVQQKLAKTQSPQKHEIDPDFWAHKPYWCQPWSIVLTGTIFVTGARQLFHGSNIVTAVAAVPILVWWWLFLVLVPANFKSYLNEE